MFKTTKMHARFWRRRKIDWVKDYLATWDHPHRKLVVAELRKRPFRHLCEFGCASGPNLVIARQAFPHAELGGIDVNADAIAVARRAVPGGMFDVRALDEGTFFPDRCVDVVLADMALIYVGPARIRKVLAEMRRICRQRVILVEFHSESWLARMALAAASGYHAYDWPRLLEEAGFYDAKAVKIPEESWPGGDPQRTYGYVITANAI